MRLPLMEAMSAWALTSSADLLRAHGRLMHGLCDDAGQWRSSRVASIEVSN